MYNEQLAKLLLTVENAMQVIETGSRLPIILPQNDHTVFLRH